MASEVSRISVSSKNDPEVENKPAPKKKGLFDCCNCSCIKRPKHKKELTKWEIDYAVHLRTKSAFAETDRKGS